MAKPAKKSPLRVAHSPPEPARCVAPRRDGGSNASDSGADWNRPSGRSAVRQAPSAPASSVAAYGWAATVGALSSNWALAPDGKRSRPEMAPQRLEKIESAPGNGRV